MIDAFPGEAGLGRRVAALIADGVLVFVLVLVGWLLLVVLLRRSAQTPGKWLFGIAVVAAIVRAWEQAAQRERPHRGFLFRSALLYQRVTGEALDYAPGATRADLQRMLGTMREWMRSRSRNTGGVPATDGDGR